MLLIGGILGVFVTFALFLHLERQGHGLPRRRRPQTPQRAKQPPPHVSASYVQHSSYSRRKLLEPAEFRVFCEVRDAAREIDQRFLVCPQVSLGEVLSAEDNHAFRAINSKRCDILVVDGSGLPILAVEYHGMGHHQNPQAATRDAIKMAALNNAGVKYKAVFPNYDRTMLRREVMDLLDPGRSRYVPNQF